MNYSIEHIARDLRAAREQKRISQRELSARSGVPQSHISKIESGAVDLRVSSLVALSRALGLELTLIPRNAVSAVQSIVRTSSRGNAQNGQAAPQTDLESVRPAYSLDEDGHG